MIRTPLVALALLVTLSTPPAHAQGTQDLDVEAWLQRPGVRLLAVEFYATWCKPCMAAVPAWKDLHELYADQGLRLIVVATRDPRGQCQNPGWNPDQMVCDTDGRIADAMGVGDSLPSAFLWSWRGDLIVRRGHVAEVAEAVGRELVSMPRLIIESPTGDDHGTLKSIVPFVQSELLKTDKVSVVAGPEADEALAKVRKRSHHARFSDRTRCKVGEALAANSVLRLAMPSVGGKHHLALQLYTAETGCLSASALAHWNPRRPHVSVAEGVSELLGALRVPFESPAGKGTPTRARVPERTVDEGAIARDWAPNSRVRNRDNRTRSGGGDTRWRAPPYKPEEPSDEMQVDWFGARLLAGVAGHAIWLYALFGGELLIARLRWRDWYVDSLRVGIGAISEFNDGLREIPLVPYGTSAGIRWDDGVSVFRLGVHVTWLPLLMGPVPSASGLEVSSVWETGKAWRFELGLMQYSRPTGLVGYLGGRW